MVPLGEAGSLHRQLAHGQRVEVEHEPASGLLDDEVDHGPPAEVVAEVLPGEVEVVVLHAVGEVSVPRYEGISLDLDGLAHGCSSAHGPIGLPIHRVLSGTDSPRMTSDTGPTVA